jgi:hypothetical protein
LPFDQLKELMPDRPDDVMSSVHAMLAEATWHSFHGRSQESLDVLERAATMVKSTRCVNSHTILVMPMLARACRLRATDLVTSDQKQRSALRKRSLRLSKWSARITKLFPGVQPLALRELSCIYRDMGRIKKALKYATKSCTVAAGQQASHEEAQSELLRAQLAVQLGLPDAETHLESAERIQAAFQSTIDEAVWSSRRFSLPTQD